MNTTYVLQKNDGHSTPIVIHLNQYSAGEMIQFQIANVDELQSVRIEGAKSDMQPVVISATNINGNKFTITTTEQMTAVVGRSTYEVAWSYNDHTDGTANFYVDIEPAPISRAITSGPEITDLKKDIDKLYELGKTLPDTIDGMKKELDAKIAEVDSKLTDTDNKLHDVDLKVDSAIGTINIAVDEGKKQISDAIAATSNSLKRLVWSGKPLGTSITAEQYAAIKNGTFEGMGLGDYWEFTDPDYSGSYDRKIKLYIADFDYLYGSGNHTMWAKDPHQNHTITLLTNGNINRTIPYDNTNHTTDASTYLTSTINTSGCDGFFNVLSNLIGSDHIATVWGGLPTKLSLDGVVGGYDDWINVEAGMILTSATSVFGYNFQSYRCDQWYRGFPDQQQFAVFRANPGFVNTFDRCWLRDTVARIESSRGFATMIDSGSFQYTSTRNKLQPLVQITVL